jgi:antitoxin component of MazEF toxin-antitoxin module
MIKSLTRHGNSWALVIDKPILDLLKINPEQPVQLSTNGQRLTIEAAPAEDDATAKAAHRDQVNAASERIHKRHAGAFRKLAE